ncbi:BglG family transcription antiterminator [Salipaludibacillus agaradhaerens]|uniref:Ascorbate-specific PTS system EIIA component n=1 Tax=Salipaludibacillus agaradhaerens TaxID=76935 RepID=A0A9Q4B018_SALAG|nr:BglG family transcription antiterminator [Salipaludibacillus agaradhaerens]MCR6095621.1 BglG family transcription antiterminator [Salipaludibacillus agaradhaerens]MCR6114819.1 BglG family transcription antiterminator [Salipaludibacillus agaradhaerens]
MQLDDRSWQLLMEVMGNPSIRNKDLERKYHLNRRQISYSFEKINDWLNMSGMPKVKRNRQGQFLIDPVLITTFQKEQEDTKAYVLSEQERARFLILMLLGRNEELSLFHLTTALDVSKNTALRDLKNAQELVSEMGLNIEYSRQSGYRIVGNEFKKRKLLSDITKKVLNIYNGQQLIMKIMDIPKEQIKDINRRIENVEKTLDLKFTDEKIATMPYIFLFILRRIKFGKKIRLFMIHFNELSDTKEYKVAEEFLSELDHIPMEERLFITLYLLTSNVSSSKLLTEKTMPELIQAIDEMLSIFEKKACIYLNDRQQLLNKILLHLKPAYYRIKYKLTETNALQDSVSKEFEELHHLVRKSTEPLVNLIGSKIPESETTYLTMLIGGWLTRQGVSINEKIKAVVVCPNGVSVSRLMYSVLSELFPEFIFLDTLSVREFNSYTLNYDIVFSPVIVETEAKLFIVKTFIEKEEKHRLRKQVMREINGYVPSDMNTEEVMAIIAKYATIKNKQELEKSLGHYFSQDNTPSVIQQYEDKKPDLSDLITEKTIRFKKSVVDWEEAICTSAQPLLHEGSIHERYVDAIIQNYEPADPYIVIGPGLAIPHAGWEEGVNQLAMSLLRLEKPVKFSKDVAVQLIIVIAAPDKQQHLRALMQLMKLARNHKDVTKLIKARTPNDVMKVIRKYATEE